MGVWTLYRFKLSLFLGPIRHQPAAIVGFGLLAVLLVPSAFSFGYFLPELPWATGGLTALAEVGALGLSVVVAFFLPTALSGGLLVHPAEIDFVATAPVTVRQFVLADLLLQGTVYGTAFPLVFLGAAGYTIRTGAPLWAALVPIAAFLLLGFVVVTAIQVLGIARLLQKRWAGPAIGLVFVLLLAPAILRFALRLPTGYAGLPYPTSAAVDVALLPFGAGSWTGLPVLLAYAGGAAIAHAWATSRGSLPNLRPTFAFATMFQPGLQKQRQQEAMLRAFGRLRLRGARLHRPSLVGTMTRLHLVRMTRDGTLFMTAILGAVFGAIYFGAPEAGAVGGSYAVVVLPVAAVAQWMASDRPNLWLVAVSGPPPQAFFQGMWLSLGAFTAVVGTVLSAIPPIVTGRLDASTPVVVVGAALGAVAVSVVCAARFPYPPNALSIRALVHFLLTGVGAGLGGLPVLAAMTAAGSLAPWAAPLAGLAVIPAVALLLHLIVSRGAANPEV
jgi:hypothetical protein